MKKRNIIMNICMRKKMCEEKMCKEMKYKIDLTNLKELFTIY